MVENIAQTQEATTPKLSIEQENSISSTAIANRFLNEVSESLKQSPTADRAADQVHSLYLGLMDDPVRQQVMNQIATDMKDQTTMSKLGLSGSAQLDKQGNATSLEFSNPQTEAAYQHALIAYEQDGNTPTQARGLFDSAHGNYEEARGTITYGGAAGFPFN